MGRGRGKWLGGGAKGKKAQVVARSVARHVTRSFLFVLPFSLPSVNNSPSILSVGRQIIIKDRYGRVECVLGGGGGGAEGVRTEQVVTDLLTETNQTKKNHSDKS